MSYEANQQSIYPAHIFHQNINSHLNAILQYRCLTDVETCVFIRQDFINYCILSNNIKQKIEERVMLSYYMNKMSLNTPDKSLLSMKC